MPSAIAIQVTMGCVIARPAARRADHCRNGPQRVFQHGARNTSENREHRLSVQQQQRRDQDQQQMLRHVRLEQEAAECVERRCERDPDRDQAGEK
jgi:hypothetical protein